VTVDAINFGSGWFPTLRKRDGRSGYFVDLAALVGQRCDPVTAMCEIDRLSEEER